MKVFLETEANPKTRTFIELPRGTLLLVAVDGLLIPTRTEDHEFFFELQYTRTYNLIG